MRRCLQVNAAEDGSTLFDNVGTAPLGDTRNRNSLEVVFGGGHVTQPALERRTSRVHARKNSFEASKSGRREARPGNDALNTHLEAVAAWAALQFDRAPKQATVGRRHRIPHHRDSLNGFKWEID